jgi:hypothetical protein
VFAGQAASEPIQVYLLAGQSNMLGAGKFWELPTEPFNYLTPQSVSYSYDLDIGAKVSNGFEQLRPGVYLNSFGPELSFGRFVDEASAAPIGIIKVAAGGTSLALDWDPEAPAPGRALYPRMLQHVTNALASLGGEGTDYQVAGVLWVHGESDTSAAVAPAYHDNLTDFIQQVRTDLNNPQLPFYIGRLNRGANLPNVKVIRQAQADVAREDPYTIAVDLDALPLRYDSVHYTPDGLLGLGEVLANAVIYGPPAEDFDVDGLVTDDDLNLVVANWGSPAPASGDVDGDGTVGLADLRRVVNRIVARPPPLGVSDVTGDDFVGIEDLNILLQNWNQNVPPGDLSYGDVYGDGFIGIEDLNRVLTQWNTSPIDPALYTPTFEDLDLDGGGWIGIGDIELLLLDWSFTTEFDPDMPLGLAPNPVAADFNADGVVDVEDLRFLIDLIPSGFSALAGDLNGDGFVDIADLNIILANFSQSVPPGDVLLGDATGEGFVGIEDLNLVLGHWNTGVPPTQSASVPEPSSGWLLLGVLACLGFRRRVRCEPAVVMVSLALFSALPVHAGQSLINQGTRDWVAAATTGRADMLILGDSIVNHGIGWTGGIAHAASTRIGLAGTGMSASLPYQGELASYPGLGGGSLHLATDWIRIRYSMPDNLEGYVMGSNVSLLGTTAPSPRFWQAIGYYDDLLDRSAAYDWQLWVAATGTTDGTIRGLRASRLQTPYTRTVLQTSPAVAVPMGQSAPRLVELSFDAAPGELSNWHEFGLVNTSKDMAVFYNRLINPNATGITVSGWSYSGGTMNDFVTEQYNNGRFDQAGRAAYLKALVHGNSGKLNVVLAVGVNDSNENEASLTQGITPGYAVEAFIDNIQTQINLVTADWALAGLPAGDLSFTLPSTYQIGPELIGEARVLRLQVYRDALRVLAATDPRISFIDMWGASPDAALAVANNYIYDGEHPSRTGALLYGSIFMNELLESVPLPGDLDGDGFVGLQDLNLVLTNWNIAYKEPWVSVDTPQDYRADPTFDGFVGIDDLNMVLSNWNAGTPPGPGSNVPEPWACPLFLTVFCRRGARPIGSVDRLPVDAGEVR